ncbi:MAG: hypothetical protein WBG32_00120 [Nodosilinea sp.]
MPRKPSIPKNQQFQNYRNQLLAKKLDPTLATEAAFVLAYKDPTGRSFEDQLVIDQAFKSLRETN